MSTGHVRYRTKNDRLAKGARIVIAGAAIMFALVYYGIGL